MKTPSEATSSMHDTPRKRRSQGSGSSRAAHMKKNKKPFTHLLQALELLARDDDEDGRYLALFNTTSTSSNYTQQDVKANNEDEYSENTEAGPGENNKLLDNMADIYGGNKARELHEMDQPKQMKHDLHPHQRQVTTMVHSTDPALFDVTKTTNY